jgi:pyrroloquinoline quinone biosynthesis protein E
MKVERPFTLIAELTYRCPLRCAYCSNPVQYDHTDALNADTWCRILREAEALGVVQVNLTGGEPLLREDLETIVLEAHDLHLYTNLITSGVPLTYERLVSLRNCGLSSVQLSIQSAEQDSCNWMAGTPAFDRKLTAARWITDLGLPLTLNVVLHRHNLRAILEIIRLAETLGAQRLELANVQYLGWALTNRSALLPDSVDLNKARAIAEEAKARLAGIMEILFVIPDYYTGVPRACMDGWGRRYIVVSPDGLVLPCHAAHTIPGVPMVSAAEQSLAQIWEQSELFNLFRGHGWMPEPCRTCPQRAIDYGGCRCQAFHLTGVAAATDPACQYSPDHRLVAEARTQAGRPHRTVLLQPRVLKGVP